MHRATDLRDDTATVSSHCIGSNKPSCPVSTDSYLSQSSKRHVTTFLHLPFDIRETIYDYLTARLVLVKLATGPWRALYEHTEDEDSRFSKPIHTVHPNAIDRLDRVPYQLWPVFASCRQIMVELRNNLLKNSHFRFENFVAFNDFFGRRSVMIMKDFESSDEVGCAGGVDGGEMLPSYARSKFRPWTLDWYRSTPCPTCSLQHQHQLTRSSSRPRPHPRTRTDGSIPQYHKLRSVKITFLARALSTTHRPRSPLLLLQDLESMPLIGASRRRELQDEICLTLFILRHQMPDLRWLDMWFPQMHTTTFLKSPNILHGWIIEKLVDLYVNHPMNRGRDGDGDGEGGGDREGLQIFLGRRYLTLPQPHEGRMNIALLSKILPLYCDEVRACSSDDTTEDGDDHNNAESNDEFNHTSNHDYGYEYDDNDNDNDSHNRNQNPNSPHDGTYPSTSPKDTPPPRSTLQTKPKIKRGGQTGAAPGQTRHLKGTALELYISSKMLQEVRADPQNPDVAYTLKFEMQRCMLELEHERRRGEYHQRQRGQQQEQQQQQQWGGGRREGRHWTLWR